MTAPHFTLSDLDRAHWDWWCSCGPAALAVIAGLTLDEVRPHFNPAFPGYTTLTRMFHALRNADARYDSVSTRSAATVLPWPRYGLARIQWHGPWTASGENQRWAYTHTHWIGVCRLQLMDGTEDPSAVCVWDCNAMEVGAGWSPLAWWSSQVVPRLTREIKRATGGWHITHAIEVERP